MKVTTINGEQVLKTNARKIKKDDGTFGYYKIGETNVKDSGDCYKINNIFYILDKGRITWDYSLSSYVLKSSTLTGVIDTDLNEGSFAIKDYKYLYICNEKFNKRLCMNDSIGKELGYTLVNDTYYNPKVFGYKELYPRQRIDNSYKNTLPYNFRDSLPQAIKYYNSYKYQQDEELDNFLNKSGIRSLLSKYTFGVELETTAGMIPEHICKNLGVRPVRDGSITGLEYVTIPLSGEKGIYALKEIVESIIKYTDSDFSCSMHIHVGGIPRTPEFITAMYKFAYYFQDNVYKMFPRYKEVNDGVKRQCYTAPLDSMLMTKLNFKAKSPEQIKEDLQKIVYHLSGKHEAYKDFIPLEMIDTHPSDPNQSSKWHMKERYKWLNLIPIIFTNKQTIEYRTYTVPDTVEKAISFLLMSLLITDYVSRYTTRILLNPETVNGFDFNLLCDNLGMTGTLKKMFSERLSKVASITNTKGAFFEEDDVELPKRIFSNPVIRDKSQNPYKIKMNSFPLYENNRILIPIPFRNYAENDSAYVVRVNALGISSSNLKWDNNRDLEYNVATLRIHNINSTPRP